MSYISGGVTISNTVTTKISGSVKTELIDTNARLEAIENELGRISNHLATIAKTIQDSTKKSGDKGRRHIESIAPPIAMQEPEKPKMKSAKSSARGSVGKSTGTISGYTASPINNNFSDFLTSMKYDDYNKNARAPF